MFYSGPVIVGVCRVIRSWPVGFSTLGQLAILRNSEPAKSADPSKFLWYLYRWLVEREEDNWVHLWLVKRAEGNMVHARDKKPAMS